MKNHHKKEHLLNSSAHSLQIFCDFDGTITSIDGTDAVLQRYALPKWREWEVCWESGEISSQECLSRQVELIRTDRKELERFIRTLTIDEGIFELDRLSRMHGTSLTIVSDGLDIIVRTVLQQHGLQHIPFYANRLVWPDGGSPALQFPYASRQCARGAGTCKCEVTGSIRLSGTRCAYIGDGLSDLCVSKQMDEVYGKGALLSWCEKQGIPCHPYVSLFEVAESLFQKDLVNA
jgi:2,3-diketo-5-methylthio-1-phosphopentane phosphatase